MDRVTASDQTQHWQRRLSKLKLPVSRNDRAELLKQLADPNGTAIRIGQRLNNNPLTCLHLFSEANRYELNADPIIDPSHAISMLGLDNCASLFRALPVFPEAGANLQFRRVISNSLLAAELAQHLANKLRLAHSRDAYWCALYHCSSRWLLALAAPDKLDALQRKQNETAAPNHLNSEQQLLGCDSWQLGEMLPKIALLPRISKEYFLAWKSLTKKDWIAASRLILCTEKKSIGRCRGHYLDLVEGSSALKRLKNHSAGAVILANLLVDELDKCWHSRQSQRLIRLTASWLQQPPERVDAHIKQLALKVSNNHPIFAPGPAGRLLAQWPGQTSQVWQPESKIETPNKASQRQAQIGRDLELIKKIHRRLRQPNDFDFKRILELLLKALHQGLGAEHVTLWLPHTSRNMLIPQYALADIEPIRTPIGLSRQSLFNKLLEKPRELHLQPGHAYWNQVPGYFKANTSEGECLFRSLFHRERPIAILYLDRGDSRKGFKPQEINLFHTLIRDFEWALQQLGARKSSAQSKPAPVQSP